MARWENCKADIYYQDGRSACLGEAGYDVRIDQNEIVVSYHDGDGHVVYKGANPGNGHFELEAPERDGHTTLHQLPGNEILEGFWVENGMRGMWAIFLDEAEYKT
jgi:hypothetical protein